MNISDVDTEEEGVAVDLSVPNIIMCIIFGILGICGNGIVLFVIAKVKDLHDMTNFFIANQSLIDLTASILLLAVFVVPLPPIPHNNPILARFLCGFWYTQYPFWVTVVATVVNLMIVTIERYVAVIHPLRSRNRLNKKLIIGVAFIPWLIGFLHMSYLVVLSDVNGQTCYQFQWPSKIAQPAVGIYTFLVFFVLSFAVMFFMYTHMLLELRRHDPNVGPDSGIHQVRNYRTIAKRNLAVTMMILSTCFMVCWLPNQIIYLVYCLGGEVDFNGVTYYVTIMVSYINMWINPLVYALRYKKFQMGLRLSMGCSQHKSTKKDSVNVTSK